MLICILETPGATLRSQVLIVADSAQEYKTWSPFVANRLLDTPKPLSLLLIWVMLDMEAFQPHKLLEPEFAQRDTLARVLPTRPRKVLLRISATVQ